MSGRNIMSKKTPFSTDLPAALRVAQCLTPAEMDRWNSLVIYAGFGLADKLVLELDGTAHYPVAAQLQEILTNLPIFDYDGKSFRSGSAFSKTVEQYREQLHDTGWRNNPTESRATMNETERLSVTHQAFLDAPLAYFDATGSPVDACLEIIRLFEIHGWRRKNRDGTIMDHAGHGRLVGQ